MTETLTPEQFHDAVGFDDWRVLLFFNGACTHYRTGSFAKGLALGLVGGLLSYATLTLDRQKQGLDGAMQTILAQPFGRFLLTAAALGFAAFGVFTILQSRYRRM